MIKNIIFDLGDVIHNIDMPRAAINFAKLSGKSTDEVVALFQQHQVFRQLETGILSEAAFRDYLRQILACPHLSDAVVDMAWNSLLLDAPPARVARVQELAQQYRVFLLSNTSSIHIAEVNQIMNRTSGIEKLHDLFEITFLSYEMGLMKPDPAIYLRVLEEGGMLASETLFLDDNADNIKSAQSLGIQTIQVQKPTTILEYLADF
ncbi:MAG: HAD family phosphatase [Runella slithyformis]|nr:MAG: HAD family phosphatase [Runella slithyformis]TAG23820.1 MAG: HAD family phosphatase [Cytophagales bacterium]TAG43253.1 MAG: HAD family phosphatase [Cytophagia bacterium]TAF28344.1 MAG: HAD family phosphatase [Runella slithyformis]TAF81944.1 MAG: HAD family phosphatase [Runella slithyformis]